VPEEEPEVELPELAPLELELELELLDLPPLELELTEPPELPELLELELLEPAVEVLSVTVVEAGDPKLTFPPTEVSTTRKLFPRPLPGLTGTEIDFGATSPSDHVRTPVVEV
jgi:hypothetical protein